MPIAKVSPARQCIASFSCFFLHHSAFPHPSLPSDPFSPRFRSPVQPHPEKANSYQTCQRSARLLAGSLTALLASHSAQAASQRWDDRAANSAWDNSSLNGSGAAWTDGNDAAFGATGVGPVQQAAGSYSATGAGGTIVSSNFTGAGTLIVTSGPVSGFSTWASANAGSHAAGMDCDKHGMPNGVEYFMGSTGSTFTANPAVVTVGAVRTVTSPRDPAAIVTFKVQISDTLAAGGWTDVVPPNASIDQCKPNKVIYTLPSGVPTKFCRLSVMQ